MCREFFEERFGEIDDTRFQSYVDHKLVDVLILVMCGVLCGIDELQEILIYGKENSEFLSETFGVDSIPSKSTLTRIMNMVDGEKVGGVVAGIMREMLGVEGEVVAFDGKTICATAKGNREKLHIMTAYITQTGVVLGQQTVDEKTNEIPIMQEMLKYIELKGKVVTADAMHCQKETAALVVEGGGDYILGLKANQETFYNETKLYLDDCISDANINVETAETKEKNAGRLETRICYKSPSVEWLENINDWRGLNCVFAIDRIFQSSKGTSTERSYYISSLTTTPAELLRLTREHWKIEAMHYQLDVTFSEDDCTILSTNGQKTFNIFRKLALALHRNYINTLTAKTKPSIKSNMFKALLSKTVLTNVLSSALTFS